MRTEVCLTVDIEFNVAGTFEDPARYLPIAEPSVCCAIDGKEQGLGFLLESLDAVGAKATFFVEALNPFYFGDAPMAGIARRIVAAGQDVQLHVHPCWRHFRDADWRAKLATPPDDSCSGRPRAELDAIIGDGLAAFARWGIQAPKAVRAGNLQADLAFYRVLEAHGIRLASNLGISAHWPAEPELQLAGGRHWIGGVLEVPVLTYNDPRPNDRAHQRLLAITSASKAEMRSLLWQARRSGAATVVVLTHAAEFIKQRGFRYETLYRNRINQARLIDLLRFVASHDQDFAMVTFGGSADAWLAAADTDVPALSVPTPLVLGRMVQNGINDFFLRL